MIVRMSFHEPTINCVARRSAEGLPKRDIIRCLKRYLVRGIYKAVMTHHRARQITTPEALREVLTYRGVNAMAEALNAQFEAECIRNSVMRPRGG